MDRVQSERKNQLPSNYPSTTASLLANKLVPVVGIGLTNPLIFNNLRRITFSSIPDYSLTTQYLFGLTWQYSVTTRLLAILLAVFAENELAKALV